MRILLLLALSAAPVHAAPVTVPTHAPMVIAGGTFTPGLYRIAPVGRDNQADPDRKLCAATPEALIRLNHSDATGCSDRFVQPGSDRVVVTYSCPARGWGRTELRRETAELYQIDTQGFEGRIPFATRVEARRIGACDQATSIKARR